MRAGNKGGAGSRRGAWGALLGLAGALALLPPAARAQAALEEVTVTAQRTTDRLQDVPVAVTAISADEPRHRCIA